MVSSETFLTVLERHTKGQSVKMTDEIFGSGINMSSIAFTEFVMDLEEECDIDIDIDDLDASIVTVAQLYERVSTY